MAARYWRTSVTRAVVVQGHDRHRAGMAQRLALELDAVGVANA